MASAEHYLPTGPFSVMNKSEVAASGNKHDFYWFARHRPAPHPTPPLPLHTHPWRQPHAPPLAASGATYFWPCNVSCAESRNYQGEKFNCSAWSNVPNDMGLPDSWPGPCDLATGLPWTSHDLYADPYWENMDRDTFDALSYALFPLIMSYFHTGNATVGARAVHLLRVCVSSRPTRLCCSRKINRSVGRAGISSTPRRR